MSAYRDYIDRISVDEEQHEKLLQAVITAEADAKGRAGTAPERAQTQPTEAPSSGGTENGDAGQKIRRFPVKKWGLAASAAVLALVLFSLPSLFSGKNKMLSQPAADAVTHAGISEDCAEHIAETVAAWVTAS